MAVLLSKKEGEFGPAPGESVHTDEILRWIGARRRQNDLLIKFLVKVLAGLRRRGTRGAARRGQGVRLSGGGYTEIW